MIKRGWQLINGKRVWTHKGHLIVDYGQQPCLNLTEAKKALDKTSK